MPIPKDEAELRAAIARGEIKATIRVQVFDPAGNEVFDTDAPKE